MLKTFSRFFFFSLFSASVFIQACGQVSQVSTPNKINPFANVTGNSLGFDVDPPFFTLDANGNQKGLDTALPGACGNVVLSWSPATDLVSGNNIIYYIYQSLTPGGENFSAPPTYQTVQFQQTNFLVQNLLPKTKYYYVVRARDEAGNLSVIDPKNLVEQWVTTWAPRVNTGPGPNLYCPGGYSPLTASWLSYAGDAAQLTGSGMGNVTTIGFNGTPPVNAFATSTGIQAPIPSGALSGILTTSAGNTSDTFLSFLQPVNLSNSAAGSFSPAMAVSGSVSGTNIAMVWSDVNLSTGQGTIYYSGSSDNGTTFSNPVPVSSPGRFSSEPSVAFGAGNIYVTWTDFDKSDNNSDIYFSWSPTTGTVFSPPPAPLNISRNGGISTSSRVSYFQNQGNVAVVWEDNSVLYGLTSVWGSTSTDVYLAGTNGSIYHSSDFGATWAKQNFVQNGYTLTSVWGTTANDVYAVGTGGTILHFDGTGWSSPHSSGTTFSLNGVYGFAANDVYAVGSGGTILHYDGTGWSSPHASGTPANLNGVFGFATNDVYAVGGNGTILHYDGTGWSSPYPSGTTANLNGVFGFATNDVYAIGGNGTVVHYDGTGWSSQASGTLFSLNSIWGTTCTPFGASTPVNVIYAGAAGGKIIKKLGTAAWESNSVVIGGDFTVNGLWGALSPTCPIIYGVQGDGPGIEWNGVDWRAFWPESTLGEIVYRQFPPAGPTYPLAAPVTLSSASSAVPPRTAASPEILPVGSDLWFSWTEGIVGTTYNKSELYLDRTADGVNFSPPPATLVASPANCFSYQFPRMAYDGGSMIYLVWEDSFLNNDPDPSRNCQSFSSAFTRVQFSKFNVPAALNGLPTYSLSTTVISSSSGSAMSPVLATSGGNLTVAWTDTSQNSKDELFLITSPDGGGTFTPPVDFSSPFLIDPLAISYNPFLIASGGSFYLGWTQYLWPVGTLPQNAEVFFSHF